MDRSREAHWQAAWSRAGLATARRDPRKSKFYALVAYPGSSGFLHIGHLRGLTVADALHRFYRMKGRAVYFPTGTHASGLPAVTFAGKVRDREPNTLRQLEEFGVPADAIGRLEEPSEAARFLGRTYLEVFRALGLLIDEGSYVTTIDEDYRAFIRWQFHRLDDAGELVQAPHYASVCPVCGPVSVDPSETDLSRGGTAEWIIYTTLPFRLDDGRYLLAATLRPETVYGVTNLWLPVDGTLSTWHWANERFLVSSAAAARLVEQHGGHVGAEVPVGDLVGRSARAPITDAELPILSSALVEPSVGTGVVMSVPAHAPADWVAIQELPEHDRHRIGAPIEVIVTERPTLSPSEVLLLDGEGPPAERAARATGARSLADAEALQAATERLYRLELVHGRMRPDLLGGLPVARAREEVARRLLEAGRSPEVREFSEPVVCRNGHDVVIQRVPDQWFIRYSDPAWKAKTKALVERMRIAPEEYGRELPGILDWLGDRPCTRRGRWLGTPFPKDESWVIEPIADSTFYPAYFPVRRFVASGEVPLASLTDAFFDFVFLGRGPGEPSLGRPLQEEVRAEFQYWYPLDVNIGGKEHKRVHFPVFLATHALLLPPELQPKGIFVHWWLTEKGGGKISKKQASGKGGVIPPIRAAFERWGADALRLFYAQAASPSQDIEWDPALADAAAERIGELERLALRALSDGPGGSPELDRWLSSRMHEVLLEVHSAFPEYRFRDAAEAVYATVPAVVRRYLQRGGEPGPGLRAAAEAWVRLMSPITPHLAEELGEGHGSGLVAARPMPEPRDFALFEEAIATEALIDLVEEDLRSVLKAAAARSSKPEAVVFFVAAPWKRTVEAWLRERGAPTGGPPPVRDVMERAARHPELAEFRSEIPKYVLRVEPLLRSEAAPAGAAVDEVGVLKAAEGYLLRRFGFRSVGVYREEEAAAHDPLGRRERARPGRPAFYLFGGAEGGGAPSARARPDPLADRRD
jgi:leucyl-tRNA synthetase